jgi:hypothetical protein
MTSQATALPDDSSPCVKIPSFAAHLEEVTQSETRRFGSQYWPTRVSGIDASLRVEGGPRSVQRTGSQTTKARTRPLRSSSRIFSSAEAPRTQTLQVGDSNTRTRT